MKPQLCKHRVNEQHCRLCQAERQRQREARLEKERKQREWEAKHPDKHKLARRVMGLATTKKVGG